MRILFQLLLIVGAGWLPSCAENHSAAESTDSTDPLTAVQALYRAAASEDNETIGRLLGDDVEWLEAEGGPFEAGNPYRGVQGVGAGVFGPIAEAYADFRVTPDRFLVDGDRVLAEGRYTGTHRGSGKSLDAAFAHVFTVKGERITHYQQYTDTYQWRQLADTPPQD